MTTIVYNVNGSTLTLNGRIINDFVAGDIITLAPANPVTSRIQGHGRSVAISRRVDADVHDLTINVMVDSSDYDWFMNAMNQGNTDAGEVIFNGSLIRNYLKDGTPSTTTWRIENGSFTDRPTNTINDQDGNVLAAFVIQCYAYKL